MPIETGAVFVGGTGDFEAPKERIPDMKDTSEQNENKNSNLREKITKEIQSIEVENVDWSKMFEDLVQSHGPECVDLDITNPAMLKQYALQSGEDNPSERIQERWNKQKASESDLIKTPEISHSIWDDKQAKYALLIQNEWLPKDSSKIFPGVKQEQAESQLKIILARNLSLKGVHVSKETIAQEVKHIQETRETYKDFALFKNRNVVLLACSNYKNDKFAPDALQTAIKKQQGAGKSFDAMQGEHRNTAEKKQAMLNKILNTPPPLTVYFDGHGMDEALVLGGNINMTTDKMSNDSGRSVNVLNGTENDVITKDDIVAALKKRAEKYPNSQDPSQKDVFVLASCYGHNFSREVLQGLGNSPKPIFVTAAEFGQRDYSNEQSAFSSDFAENILDLKSGETTTLGTIFKNENIMFNKPKDKLIANPSVYIPDNEQIMQLTKNEARDENIQA